MRLQLFAPDFFLPDYVRSIQSRNSGRNGSKKKGDGKQTVALAVVLRAFLPYVATSFYVPETPAGSSLSTARVCFSVLEQRPGKYLPLANQNNVVC